LTRSSPLFAASATEGKHQVLDVARAVEKKYVHLDLRLLRVDSDGRDGDAYRAEIVDSIGRSAEASLGEPLSGPQLYTLLNILEGNATRRDFNTRNDLEIAKAYGTGLFCTVFRADILAHYRDTVKRAKEDGMGVCLRVHLQGAPELGELPWEYLHDPKIGRFLALSVDTPVVRLVDVPEKDRRLAVEPPLRVLVVGANPRDYEPLDVEREWNHVRQALAELRDDGKIELTRLERATWSSLQSELRRKQYHVLHFIGHGEFDRARQTGHLILEDVDGLSHSVSAQRLGVLLQNHDQLRLVVLNACEGGRAGASNLFTGTAQVLMRHGVPAVIAMQYPVSDDAAITFGRELYAALVDGCPLDMAMTEARVALQGQCEGVEWGVPVLYIRPRDARLWDIQTPLPASNLPVPVTSFIGREQEVSEIISLLRRRAVRLLTLTGVGGVGKTRLALEVASRVLREFSDGSYFVPLATVRDPALVASTVAAEIKVKETGKQPAAERLKSYLRDKQVLLVLDNFEQVVDAGDFVAELLTTCPGVKVVVTSRSVLNVYGEREYPLSPLPTPDPGTVDFEEVARYDSVALFVDRAEAAARNFALNGAVAPAVVEICRRLEGIPLAIELAAAQTRQFAPDDLLKRLAHRLTTLTGGPRNLPRRHQTLRAAIDWSYGLLRKPEQQLFARLATFTGGFDLEAVQCVCSPDHGSDTAGLLLSLADQSLLQRAPHEARYIMLETVREYAAERLRAHGEVEAVAARHAAYFLSVAREAASHLAGPEEGRWLNRLDQDFGNIRTVLEWALARGDIMSGLQLATVLHRFWELRSHRREGRRWLLDLLVAAGDDAAPSHALRAEALEAAGLLAYRLNEHDEGRSLYDSALALRGAVGDRKLIARAMLDLAKLEFSRGAHSSALSLSEESLRTGRLLRDHALAAEALSLIGSIVRTENDAHRAITTWAGALDLYRKLDAQEGVASVLHKLGSVSYYEVEDAERAKWFYRECVELRRQLGDHERTEDVLNSFAFILRNEGDYGGAIRLVDEALASSRLHGHMSHAGFSLCILGMMRREQGDLRRARSLSEESLSTFKQLGGKWGVSRAYLQLSAVAYDEGDLELAIDLAEQSLALSQQTHDKTGAVFSQINLALAASASGDFERALRTCQECRALMQVRSGSIAYTDLYCALGSIHLDHGNRHEALAAFLRSVAWARKIGTAYSVATALEGLAMAAVTRENATQVCSLLGAVDAFRHAARIPRPPANRSGYEVRLAALRRMLAPSDFQTAWEASNYISLSQAVAFALSPAAGLVDQAEVAHIDSLVRVNRAHLAGARTAA